MPTVSSSLLLPGALLSLLGVVAVIMPMTLASLLGLPAPADFWCRVVGIPTLAIGLFYLQMAGAKEHRFARAIVVARGIAGLGFLVLVAAGVIPKVFLIFTVLDWGGAVVTQIALRAAPTAVLLLALAGSALPAQARATMPAVGIDHLILGVDDLERGMAEFASRTGVKPVKGGVHPGRGTQNALVALGSGRYLEILAPSREPGTTSDAMTQSSTLAPVGWALHTGDVAGVVATLRGAAFVASDVRPGARTRPDGVKLAWQTATVSGPGLEGAPFFIQWSGGSAHPSNDAPSGCTLERVTLTESDPAPLARFMRAVRVDAPVTKGASRRMTITLACPAGKVTFGA